MSPRHGSHDAVTPHEGYGSPPRNRHVTPGHYHFTGVTPVISSPAAADTELATQSRYGNSRHRDCTSPHIIAVTVAHVIPVYPSNTHGPT